jgi:hypothetical protein
MLSESRVSAVASEADDELFFGFLVCPVDRFAGVPCLAGGVAEKTDSVATAMGAARSVVSALLALAIDGCAESIVMGVRLGTQAVSRKLAISRRWSVFVIKAHFTV